MVGIRDFRKLQLGKETTAGTAVAATTIWRGRAVWNDETEISKVEEDTGMALLQGDADYQSSHSATIDLEEVAATFEQLPYLLAMAIENITAGVQDGTGGTGYVYQYDHPTNAAGAIQSYTIEVGDNQRVDEGNYAFGEEVTISGAAGEALMMSGTLRCRHNGAPDAEFTTTATLPTTEVILFNTGKLYLDATTGTMGTTVKTGTFRGFEVTIPSGHVPVETGDGSLYYSTEVYAGNVENPWTGSLTLLHDTTGEAELGFARAGTVRLLKLLFEGSTLGTAGTYTKKTLIISGAIRYSEIPSTEETDGLAEITLPFEWVWSDSLAGQVIVVNELVTLP